MGPYGWLGTIGLIVPPRTNETLLYEMMQVAPEGVSWCLSSLGLREHDLQEYAKALTAVERCTEELIARGASAIAFAGIPLSTAQGPGYHVELEQRIREAASSSVPVTTDLSACLGAFRELGVRRVTVISNYQEDVLRRLEAALAHAGVDIVGSKGIELTLAEQITAATFDTAYDLALEAFGERPDTDALFLSCPQWPLIRNIERIEAATGRPVVTQLQAIVWWARRALGLDSPVAVGGRLLTSQGTT